MPDLFLFIPDSSLCDALLEQIRVAKMLEPIPVDSAGAALRPAENEAPNILIFDSAEKDSDNEALVASFDATHQKTILLMLGGKGGIDGVAETFPKPFRLGHLISRLKYYLETAPLLYHRAIIFGPYRLDPQTRTALRDNTPEPIRLTEKETALLVFLAEKKAPATRQELLANVWGYSETIDTHTLETHIYQLRKKLDREGENWLASDAGAYRLVETVL